MSDYRQREGSILLFLECVRGQQAYGIVQKHNSFLQRPETPVDWTAVQFSEEFSENGREADKNCEDEPKRMEKLLMDSCQTMVGIKGPQDDKKLYGAGDKDKPEKLRMVVNVEVCMIFTLLILPLICWCNEVTCLTKPTFLSMKQGHRFLKV